MILLKTKPYVWLAGMALALQACSPGGTTEKEVLTAADYENATKHFSKHLNPLVQGNLNSGSWTPDGQYTYYKEDADGKSFFVVDPKAKTKELAFDHTQLAQALSKQLEEDYTPSNLPFSRILMEGNTLSFSVKGKTFSYDTQTQTLTEKDATANTTGRRRGSREYLSPDGKLAAYIDDHNLWIRDVESGVKTQLTFDGQKDYGYATNNAGWIKSDGPVLKWSPNSDKIATFQQDSRGVKEMYLTSTNVGHPKLEAWKHPLPGDSLVFKLERVIIHLNKKPKLVRLQMDSDFQRSTITDHVADWSGEFYDNDWKEDGSELAFVSSSRDHKIAHLQVADAQTGKVRSVLKEETDTYFESGVNEINWHVLFDSNEVIWFSERDNWGHLYLYDLNTGKLKNRITQGEWAVQQVRYIDEETREIFFVAGGKEAGNPYHQYLYKVNFDGSGLQLLSPEKGTHQISFSDDFNYFVDAYSTTTTPTVWVLRDRNGEKLLDLEAADISALEANGWQAPIEFSVKARDDKTDIYGLLYLPSHYDENKSYPILNYIYPGPQSGSVGYYGFRTARSDFQAVAELGFAVVAVDAMGTPKRSKSFHDAYYGNMGDNGLPDNIAAIKQLAQQYKGMDLDRVGIWGHSGGGFASTRAILAYPDFYKVAVSGAGNHDNRNYEADWGEKWQGLLVNQKIEGEEVAATNYDNQANQLLAENLKGKLLLSHGSMDDNVPPSNTLLVAEALIKANKDFDMILFPNKRHGYGDMTNYWIRKRWDYFVKHLKGIEPPKEFLLE